MQITQAEDGTYSFPIKFHATYLLAPARKRFSDSRIRYSETTESDGTLFVLHDLTSSQVRAWQGWVANVNKAARENPVREEPCTVTIEAPGPALRRFIRRQLLAEGISFTEDKSLFSSFFVLHGLTPAEGRQWGMYIDYLNGKR